MSLAAFNYTIIKHLIIIKIIMNELNIHWPKNRPWWKNTGVKQISNKI